jgi:hypothetical protein
MAEQDPHQLALKGMAADAAEAARLESLLETNPEDLEARTKLLGYYTQRSFSDTDACRRKTAHTLWMIRNRPGEQIVGTPFCLVHQLIDAEGYRKSKTLWGKQIRRHRSDTAILSNAARFYTTDDNRTAIAILKRLKRMEPRNPDWRERLGHIYHLQSGIRPGMKRSKAAAARALKEWEAALALIKSDSERFYLLTSTAPIAVDAGSLPKAARYAGSLLRLAKSRRANWNHGNALHHAHSALGRVALRKKRLADAKSHLIASARTKGSPQLDSFGPSFDLAAELLARGEAKTVTRYLELCRKFWTMGERSIDAWIKSIRESGKTDFFPVFDLKAEGGGKTR